MKKSLLFTALIGMMCFTQLTNAQSARLANSAASAPAQVAPVSYAINPTSVTTQAAPLIIGGQNATVALYPNPFHATLNVNIGNAPQNIGATLNIYDAFGTLLVTTTLNEMVSSYNMQHLNPGVYYYRIFRRNGSIQSGKIVSKVTS